MEMQSATQKRPENRFFTSFNIQLGLMFLVGIIGVALHAMLGQSWKDTSGHAWGSDDAFITYRYAKNFYDGHGIVFNPGEWVEGYSNFLHVLLMTPAMILPIKWVYAFSVGLNSLFFLGTIWLFVKLLQIKLGDSQALLGGWLLAFNPWFWVNIATGLETIVVVFIAVATLFVLEVQNRTVRWRAYALALLTVLSLLSRVDGFVLPLIVVGYLFVKKDYKLCMLIASTLALSFLCYTFWRLYYYGELMSNTYYLRMAELNRFDQWKNGVKFLIRNYLHTGLWLIVLLTMSLLLRKYLLDRRQPLGFSMIFVMLWTTYVVLAGGDFYYERFLIVLFPFSLYALLPLLQNYSPQLIKALVIVIFVAQFKSTLSDGRFQYRFPKYDGWQATGQFLQENYPGKIIAVDAAGKVPFYSGLHTIDMLGVNEKNIARLGCQTAKFECAHCKYDADYVLNKCPDLILGWIGKGDDLRWGIVKEKYEELYALKYLVNLSRKDLSPHNFVDVSNLSSEERADLAKRGYKFAVLEKKPHHNAILQNRT